MRLRPSWALLVLPLMAACGSKALRPQIDEGIAARVQADGFSLTVAGGEERLLRGEISRDGGAFIKNGQQVAIAIQSASQGAGAAGPGAAAAGIMIGSLVASQLAKSDAEGELEDAAEMRIASLRQVLDGQPLQHWYADAYQQALQQVGAAARETGALSLSLAPQALLTQDSRSVRLITEVHLTEERAPLYQGRIEVFSVPLTCEDCLPLWEQAEGEQYKAALKSNIEETIRVLLLDWQSQHFAGSSAPEQTLRYQVGQSRYVERGRLLETGETRHLFLSLRGWLKSVPVTAEP